MFFSIETELALSPSLARARLFHAADDVLCAASTEVLGREHDSASPRSSGSNRPGLLVSTGTPFRRASTTVFPIRWDSDDVTPHGPRSRPALDANLELFAADDHDASQTGPNSDVADTTVLKLVGVYRSGSASRTLGVAAGDVPAADAVARAFLAEVAARLIRG